MRRTDRAGRRPAFSRPPAGPLRLAACLAAGTLAFCGGCDPVEDTEPPSPPPVATVPPRPTTYPVPVLRVLLTGSPVQQARVGTTGGWRVESGGRVVAEAGGALGPVPVRRSAAGWRIGSWHADGRTLTLIPADGAYVRVEDTAYRGELRLVPHDEAGRFRAVNHVDLEQYLAGVLAKELYPDWHIEAYRALAVAARTFAMYQMITYGRGREYDLGDDQGSQVYGGVAGETSRSRRAVDDTRGVVLSYGDAGRERIFLAQYSACCGGRVNGAYVIRNAHRIPPLEGGQVCNDCSRCSRYRWPAVRVTKRDIHRALLRRYTAAATLSGVSRIEVRSRTPSGRAVWTDVFGPRGNKIRVRAEDIRLALLMAKVPAARKLYSMNCRMIDRGGTVEFADGRGFGHGVGLCQWGAQAKALQGRSAEEILAFYYPGAKLFRVH